MQITVRFFASLRDTAGEKQCVLDVFDGTDLAALVQALLERYPVFEGHQAMWHFAVNQTHAELDTVLRDGDRVAIFPYVGGG